MQESPTEEVSSNAPSKTGFPSTDWSKLHQAKFSSTEEGRAALEQLCIIYRPVIQACIAANSGSALNLSEDVDDLTQDFLCTDFLVQLIPNANPERGRFRCFIRTALRCFLLNKKERESTAKRGGHVFHDSIEAHRHELEAAVSGPSFDREWAMEIYRSAARRLRERHVKLQTEAELEQLWALFWDDSAAARRLFEKEAGLNSQAVNQRLYRFRTRLRECLRHEVSMTIASEAPDDIDDEARYLMDVLARCCTAQELRDLPGAYEPR
jgi:RNA polymerase sigma-70 factor (ECF subfamily)